jgi:carboxyl-terminal processing protease
MSYLMSENKNQRPSNAFQPLWIGLMLIIGIYIGSNLRGDGGFNQAKTGNAENPNKLVNILNFIEENYVDSVDKKKLIDVAITAILAELDPHSYYISPEEFAEMQEPMEGNFEGIGVEFMIQKDTLTVVTPLQGGPSEQAGILPGDRIIAVNGENIAGVKVSNDKVMKLLKGPKGTEVNLTLRRKNQKEDLAFTIVRDKIPIESVVAAFMIDHETAYIKVTRFAKTTYDEFVDAMTKMKAQGAKKLMLDLRGNGGGYLNTAIPMTESFLKKGELILYTEGKASPRRDYYNETEGQFRDLEVVILINEGSASASEILAGALQDHDRGITVGRRTFGKGLVQDEIALKDNSALRLTIARYYTPSGRSIQKPYGEGIDYEGDFEERYISGELLSADSINFPDSLRYETKGGRIVYGGGGIMPDVFVPIDTTYDSPYFNEISYMGLIRQFGFEYVDKNREKLLNMGDERYFAEKFTITDDILSQMKSFCSTEGVATDESGFNKSKPEIAVRLKAQIVRQLFGEEAYYRTLIDADPDFKKGLETLRNPSAWRNLKQGNNGM